MNIQLLKVLQFLFKDMYKTHSVTFIKVLN